MKNKKMYYIYGRKTVDNSYQLLFNSRKMHKQIYTLYIYKSIYAYVYFFICVYNVQRLCYHVAVFFSTLLDFTLWCLVVSLLPYGSPYNGYNVMAPLP